MLWSRENEMSVCKYQRCHLYNPNATDYCTITCQFKHQKHDEMLKSLRDDLDIGLLVSAIEDLFRATSKNYTITLSVRKPSTDYLLTLLNVETGVHYSINWFGTHARVSWIDFAI